MVVNTFLFMSKYKNNKKRSTQTQTTLEAKHKKILADFHKQRKQLPEKEKLLNNIKKKLAKLNKKSISELDEKTLDKIHKLELKEKNIEKDITDIKNNNDINKYYNETGDILFQYYDSYNLDSVDDQISINSSDSSNSDENKSGQKLILNFINKDVKNMDSTVQHKRKKLLEKYLHRVDKNYINIKDKDENYIKCPQCNKERTLNSAESLLVCHKCGNTEFIYIDCDKPSYKDPPPEQSNYAYKEINHFKEWLAYAQAKESTDIPSEIFYKILLEIKKRKIKNLAILTKQHMRDFLRKIGFSKYYEHSPLILMKLTNMPPIRISDHLEKRLIDMFTEVLMVYRSVKPDERTNFFSYSYILYKFLELLEFDEYKDYFTLFKGNENLKNQDKIFSKICKILRWQFIPSI